MLMIMRSVLKDSTVIKRTFVVLQKLPRKIINYNIPMHSDAEALTFLANNPRTKGVDLTLATKFAQEDNIAEVVTGAVTNLVTCSRNKLSFRTDMDVTNKNATIAQMEGVENSNFSSIDDAWIKSKRFKIQKLTFDLL